MKNGDKVRVISKSYGCTLEQSRIYKTGECIGYVIQANFQPYESNIGPCILVGLSPFNNSGEYFTYEDIELFDDPTKIIDGLFDDIIDNL